LFNVTCAWFEKNATVFNLYNTADLLFNNYRKVFTAESRKKPFYSSSTLSMLVAYQPKTTYRLHGSAFGYAGGPCIIILTRGRNELFFRIIFKEKVIFLFFIFFFRPCDANETNAFIFRCQL